MSLKRSLGFSDTGSIGVLFAAFAVRGPVLSADVRANLKGESKLAHFTTHTLRLGACVGPLCMTASSSVACQHQAYP